MSIGFRRGLPSLVLSSLLLAFAAPGDAADAPGHSKVPGKRLAKGLYTSPDGRFALRYGAWLLPGARFEEQHVITASQAVYIADDFGKAYGVICTDTIGTGITLERIAADLTVGELLKSKEFVTTGRGAELRLTALHPGGSPIASRTREVGKWVEKPNDFYEALSIFIQRGAVYRVSAGVTPITGGSAEELLARARQQLDRVLGSLEIPAPEH